MTHIYNLTQEDIHDKGTTTRAKNALIIKTRDTRRQPQHI